MLFLYYLQDYIICVKYFNHLPLIIVNYLLAFFGVLISHIFELIILILSLQHTNTMLHDANIIRASPFDFSFNKHIWGKDYMYRKRKTFD